MHWPERLNCFLSKATKFTYNCSKQKDMKRPNKLWELCNWLHNTCHKLNALTTVIHEKR